MISENNINGLFEQFIHLNVLVIGDVMIDSFIWGKVDRISPEAPVPIVSVERRENRLGGAANVALNVQSLGANPIICSVIGNDQRGNDFVRMLKEQKLSDAGIIRSESRVTTTKFRVMGNNIQLLRVDEEVEHDISDDESGQLFGRIKSQLENEKIDAIIFEDYDKGVIKEKLIEKVVTLANSRNVIVTVDPKKKNFSNYRNVNLFKPNLKEIKDGLKIDIDVKQLSEIEKAADMLHKNQDIKIVLLTLAAEGVYVSERLNEKENSRKLFPAHKRNIADVSGAGDTVISVATLCLAAGLKAEDAAQISNFAGGLVCEQVGVVTIDKDILKQAIISEC
jgi:rfaE bifunctional protein kinase chain/domain